MAAVIKERVVYVYGQDSTGTYDRVPQVIKDTMVARGFTWVEDGPEGVAFTGGPDPLWDGPLLSDLQALWAPALLTIEWEELQD